MVFDKQWFEQHQSKLLKLTNHFVLKYWFRRVLRINKDLKWSEKVTKLAPNNFEVSLGTFLVDKELREKIRADFRTNDKFAARLYHAFKPMWWIMHFMDWAFFERTPLLYNLDFGFNTLTAYPESGTTDDGLVSRDNVRGGFSSEAWSTIRSGTGTFVSNSLAENAAWQLQFHTSGTNYILLSRSIFCFDTSSIGTNSTVNTVDLSLFGKSKFNQVGSDAIHITSADPTSTSLLAATDYNIAKWGATSYGNVTYASWFPRFTTDVQYNDITLNASGEANIDKAGITSYGARCQWDLNNTTVGQTGTPSATAGMTINFSNETGTSKDPKLVVVYSPLVYVQTLNETVTLAATMGKAMTKAFNEVQTLTATLLLSIQKFATTVYAGNYMTAGAPVAQYPVADGMRTKIFSLIISEILNLLDGFSKVTQQVWNETLTLTDTFAGIALKFISLSEVLVLTDSLQKAFSKALNETLVLTDTFVRVFCLFLNEALVLTDTFAKQVVRIIEFIENLVLSDTFTRIPAKIFNEVLVLVDSFPKAFIQIWNEALVLTDSFAKIFAKIMTFNETLVLNDTLVKYLNGALVDIWAKTVKLTATWTKTVKESAMWIKTPKN